MAISVTNIIDIMRGFVYRYSLHGTDAAYGTGNASYNGATDANIKTYPYKAMAGFDTGFDVDDEARKHIDKLQTVAKAWQANLIATIDKGKQAATQALPDLVTVAFNRPAKNIDTALNALVDEMIQTSDSVNAATITVTDFSADANNEGGDRLFLFDKDVIGTGPYNFGSNEAITDNNFTAEVSSVNESTGRHTYKIRATQGITYKDFGTAQEFSITAPAENHVTAAGNSAAGVSSNLVPGSLPTATASGTAWFGWTLASGGGIFGITTNSTFDFTASPAFRNTTTGKNVMRIDGDGSTAGRQSVSISLNASGGSATLKTGEHWAFGVSHLVDTAQTTGSLELNLVASGSSTGRDTYGFTIASSYSTGAWVASATDFYVKPGYETAFVEAVATSAFNGKVGVRNFVLSPLTTDPKTGVSVLAKTNGKRAKLGDKWTASTANSDDAYIQMAHCRAFGSRLPSSDSATISDTV